jgi:hypothetical protein
MDSGLNKCSHQPKRHAWAWPDTTYPLVRRPPIWGNTRAQNLAAALEVLVMIKRTAKLDLPLIKPVSTYQSANKGGRAANGKRESSMRLTKTGIISVAVAALAGFFFGYNSHPPSPVGIAATASPEIRRAIPVEPEARRAIPVQVEIRKAIPIPSTERKASK